MAIYNDEEGESFMAVWRYSGHLMGIPDTILFRDEQEALKLYDVGLMCEPNAPLESVVMANALVNSAPLIAGVTAPEERRKMARYVYRISRGLIGRETAERLMYPPHSSFGAVGWFKFQQRHGHILTKLRRRAQDNNFTKFTSLLETSVFDEEGIRYSLPDHAYTEKSSRW